MLKINRNMEVALSTIKAIRENGKNTTVKSVVEKTGESQHFVDQVANKLRRAGLITSHRGPGGGYTVEKTKITALDVAKALGFDETEGVSATTRAVQAKILEALSTTEI